MDNLVDIFRLIGVIFLALMILNVMIVVHELGHFLAARWRGLKIERFQIWFGKPIWKKTYNGVQYGLGWVPAGGFVALPQMAPMEMIEGRTDGESAAPREPLPPIKPLDKIIVAFAGPLFSFLLALAFALVVWIVGRPIDEPANPTLIGFVQPGGPSVNSGLQAGDIIRKIDGRPVNRWHGQVGSVKWAIISSEEEEITFTVERDGKLMDFKVRPELRDPILGEPPKEKSALGRVVNWIFGRPPLRHAGIAGPLSTRVAIVLPNSPAAEAGIQIDDRITVVDGQPFKHASELDELIKARGKAPISMTVVRAGQPVELTVHPRKPDKPESADLHTGLGFGDSERTRLHPPPLEQIGESLQAMKNLLGAIFSRKSDISATHMGGPVMIVRIYYTLISPDTWLLIFWFSVLLNVNLAVLNLLPFPVLDGGHITMALVEWVRGRPINPRVLEYLQTVCVLLVLAFFVTVTLKDVGDLTRGGGEKIEFLPQRSSQ